MLDKIDVRDIITDHYRTLVDDATKKRAKLDYVLFLGLPLAAAMASVYGSVVVTDTAVNVLITALSILAGLLLNVLVLIHTVSQRFTVPTGPSDGKRFLQEIYANIAYCIFVSIASMAPLLGQVLLCPTSGGCGAKDWTSPTALFLTSHLFLTLLMVLKRLHILLKLDMNGRPPIGGG